MQTFRQRKYLFAVAALVLVFAGCKGESPTAPTTATTPPTSTSGGTTPPPTTANIVLNVSNATPQVNSSSVITATVTDATGNLVPNGTAVEFDTTLGTFSEGNAQTIIRTTTNGVATVTLTSAVVGPATVSAIVANVKKTASVTFSAIPVTPPPPDFTPSITGISPNFGRPQGGEVVTITGKNFQTPLHVFFDFGAGTSPKDATIISSTPTSIQVLTPAVDLGTGQQAVATVKVINQAGSANEVTVTGPTFTYQATVLTPKITTVSPASGPIDGGTRVTVYGEGFQAPIQVFVGAAEAQVVSPILFNQFTIVTPAARDATPDASGTGTGLVNIRVININSATTVTLNNAFRYVPKMSITALGPGTGSAFGGTIVTIDGNGFNDPVTVSFDGLPAQVLKVSATQILARTSRVPVPCSPPSATPTLVTNVDNGDFANGPAFVYNPEKPLITGVSPVDVTAGNSIQVTVAKPGVGIDGTALIRFTVAGATTFPNPSQITDPVGPIAFTVVVPSEKALTFPKVACTTSGGLAGTANGPLVANVIFTNVTTGCTDTLSGALTIEPSDTSCNATASAPVASVNPSTFCPQPAAFSSVSVGSAGSASQVLTVSNTGASNATALSFTASVTGANSGDFTVSPSSGSVAPGAAPVPMTVTFKPTATGARSATLLLTTNDPAKPSINVPLCGTGAP
jgi:hypothetical protein